MANKRRARESSGSSSEDYSEESDAGSVVLPRGRVGLTSGEAVGSLVYDQISRLNTARVTTRRAVEGGVLRMYTVLESQRLAFVSRTPNHALAGAAEAIAAAAVVSTAGSGPQQDEIERARRVEEAFTALEHQSQLLAVAVASVRLAEIELNPALASVPAGLAFAVSGPCTSWSVETWQECGLPRVVELLRKAFLAAFSGPKRNDNRAGVSRGLPPREEASSLSARLSSSRMCARKRMCSAMKTLVSYLKQQRQRFVTENPGHPLARGPGFPLGSNRQPQRQEEQQEHGQGEREDPPRITQEYEAMELLAPGFIKAVADTRTAMLSMEPVLRFRPAVVAFCVDAPGAKWNPLMWQECPLPRIVPIIQKVFMAAFSSQEMSENVASIPRRSRHAAGRAKKLHPLTSSSGSVETAPIPATVAAAAATVVDTFSPRMAQDDYMLTQPHKVPNEEAEVAAQGRKLAPM